MVKCPACNEDIDALYLELYVNATVNQSFNVSLVQESNSLEFTHIPERDEEPDTRDILDETYYCPKCNSEVAKSGDEAHNVLKGGV